MWKRGSKFCEYQLSQLRTINRSIDHAIRTDACIPMHIPKHAFIIAYFPLPLIYFACIECARYYVEHKVIMPSYEAIKHLIEALKHNTQHPKVQLFACRALLTLSSHHSGPHAFTTCETYMCRNAWICKLWLKSSFLRSSFFYLFFKNENSQCENKFPNSMTCRTHVSAWLGHLSCLYLCMYADNRALIRQQDGVHFVKAAMKDHLADDLIQECGSMLLRVIDKWTDRSLWRTVLG